MPVQGERYTHARCHCCMLSCFCAETSPDSSVTLVVLLHVLSLVLAAGLAAVVWLHVRSCRRHAPSPAAAVASEPSASTPSVRSRSRSVDSGRRQRTITRPLLSAVGDGT